MKSIEIANFKNFKDLRIDNLGQVNLIVGCNNAGKSIFINRQGSLPTVRGLAE